MADKFRVALAGRTGRGDYGHDLDRLWERVPDAVVVAVSDDNAEGLAKAVERTKAARGYADYREMLDKEKPDILCICTRWLDQHHAMIMAALDRGIHVLTEKPLCRTLAEADEIVQKSQMTHALVAVAHTTHYSPKLEVAKRFVAEGRLGRVLEYRGRGKEDRRGGGEDMWVLGSHVFDLIRVFGGDPTWCFARVMADGHPVRRADVVEGNEGIGPLAGDNIQAMFGMAEGATAYFASQRNAGGSPSRFGLQIFGTAGILEIGTGYLPHLKFLDDPSWSPGRTSKAWQDLSSRGLGEPEPLEDGGLLFGNTLAALDLLAAIREHRAPRLSAADARAALEMLIGCFESARVGGPVTLPLASRDNPLTRLDG
jgi:predicted dehydrogenase